MEIKRHNYLDGVMPTGVNTQTTEDPSPALCIYMLNGGAVSWSSKVQATVAKSSSESEYMGLSDAVAEAMHLKQYMKDFGHGGRTICIHEDNQGCIAMAENASTTARSKHIDIKYHFSRERIEAGDVELIYCKTEDMLADAFTKALPGPSYKKFRDVVMGVTPYTPNVETRRPGGAHMGTAPTRAHSVFNYL